MGVQPTQAVVADVAEAMRYKEIVELRARAFALAIIRITLSGVAIHGRSNWRESF